MRTQVNMMRRTAVMVVLAIVTVALAGCDDALLGALGGGGLGGWGDYYYPDWGLYDPTQDIQDVIDYRWDVMDWSNDQWDAYIRQ
ncbi:MAG TPA: hypothetical protein VM243_04380 [Phycisphaerae bacterium]|nr:hypothetical protein [Phycisphaerae bacterium]